MQLLETSGVSVQFGGLRAVDGLDLGLSEGEILSLIGPNGAGKTTLFNLISGFLTPDSGRVRFLGTDITGWPPPRIAARGLVRTFQKTSIFSEIAVKEGVATGYHLKRHARLLSILANTRSVREENRMVEGWTEEILAFTGLTPWAEILGKNLPYGKQRLLEVAVALAASPRLLLLDEPASGLNPAETNALMRLIRQIRDLRGITVLLIEHNTRLVVGISDRVVVLHHGRKIAEEPPGVMAQEPSVIEAYLGQGFRQQGSVHA